MHASHLQRGVIAVAGAVSLSLPVAESPVQPTAPTVPATTRPAGSEACPNEHMILRPRSEFPDTPIGRVNYSRHTRDIEDAVLCMVNRLRDSFSNNYVEWPPKPPWWPPGGEWGASLNLPPATRANVKGLGRNALPGLPGAAYRHAQEAVRLRWWGKVEPGKNCVPQQARPDLCDSHINPETKSTPQIRAETMGYPRGCTKGWSVAENTYVGWGQDHVTPRAAFDGWYRSPPHVWNMLVGGTEMTVQVASGSADPAAPSGLPAVTYVQMFGNCLR